jgi:hypothetical protein
MLKQIDYITLTLVNKITNKNNKIIKKTIHNKKQKKKQTETKWSQDYLAFIKSETFL